MNAKFQPNQKVVINGKEITIIGTKKNFSTNVISYVIPEFEKDIKEADLEKMIAGELKVAPKIPTPTTPKTEVAKDDTAIALQVLRAEYKTVIGKGVPVKETKNAEWIQQAIQAFKDQIKVETQKETGYTPESLAELDVEGLATVIEGANLDIDIDAYATQEELIQAISTALGI